MVAFLVRTDAEVEKSPLHPWKDVSVLGGGGSCPYTHTHNNDSKTFNVFPTTFGTCKGR